MLNQIIGISAIIIIAILILYYYFWTPEINIDGFWVGSPQFLNDTGIHYLGVNFADDKLSIVITPNNGGSSITQIYQYSIDDNYITIVATSSSGGKYILPNKELFLKYDKNEMRIYDDQHVYLVLVKFSL